MRFFRGSHMDSQGRRILRKDRRGMDPFRAGVLALVIIGIFTYLGFTKDIPFINNPFQFKAVFVSSNNLKPNSPVRIAGVNVGKVKKIERLGDTDYVVVTMSVNNEGLPIHKDAELKIRPRIFLEGNYFVDVKPGTPSAPTIDDGDTIPMTQTATPVQLDQILTTLQSDQRQDLKDLLEGYGKALTYKPTAADDVGQDPAVQGETAAESLNDSLKYGGDAFKSTAIVNQALLGTQPDDLSKLILGLGKTAEGLDRNEEQLKDLITNFNTTMAAFASQSNNLSASIRLLGPTIDAANNAFASLNAAFPPTRGFARDILPGVRETPATIKAALPWISQATRAGPARGTGRCPERLRAGHGRPREADEREHQAAAPDRPHGKVLPRRDPADRRRGHRRGPAHQRRTQLQGVLVHDGRPRRRGPELRRQRHLHPLPGRRRRPDRVHGHRGRQGREPALRQRALQAARLASVLHGQAAAVQARLPLLQEHAAQPQRPRGPCRAGARRSSAPTTRSRA